jgi:toxin FitB
MTGFLLDTNVLSEFNRKGKPNPQVEQWVASKDNNQLYVSIVTFGEIRFGIELLPSSKRRAELEHWLDHDLSRWFSGQLLGLDEVVVNQWAILMAKRQLQGKPLDILDGFLAATALHHQITLVTRNVKDFEGLGADILNPWEQAPDISAD